MEKAPRTAKGILSHRMDKVQLWADGIYMGPPALAFAGVHWGERSLITEAVRQIKGYRKALWDEGSKLFSHIWNETSQSFERKAHWGVGNGWALAGITRVLLLLPEVLRTEREELLAYVNEGLDGVLAHKRQDDLYHNILDDPSTFIETNAGQQIAYTIFRLAQHGLIDETYIKIAQEFRRAVLKQMDGYGIVRGVCGSPTFDHSGTANVTDMGSRSLAWTKFVFFSTEGQAFYVLMEAPYEDYCKAR
ncbi:glucosyl hydrolase family protein [Schizopora paradoxa]|uniref:Glucosyl hydrolase family protein n=1 Tax=Schizopora paradoxa TaxID=27342 RepID=A0A0H2S8B2_9AGAM|nr:glucosyl hydrolase family protein [Schizopora paradoxa]